MATTQAPTPRPSDSDATAAPLGTNASDDAEASHEADAPAEARRRWRPDPVVCVAAALVLVPTIAAMVSALRNPYGPTNDWALLELQVRDVGTGDTPLLGAWSRFGWDHPGPLMFYALAAFYRLVPGENGLLFAAAAVNFVAVAGAAAVTFASTRARALVTLLCLALLQLGLGIVNMSDPWNPTLPILPFALYALVCIEIALGGRRWRVPVAAGLAAFVVQSHVGFAQPVAALLLTALVVRWWASRRSAADPGVDDGHRLPWWRRALPTTVVVVLTWLPVLIDQVAGSGNIGRIARWAAGRDVGGGMNALTEGRLPPGEVARSASWLLDPIGLWLGRFQPVEAFGLTLLDGRPVVRLLWLALGAVAVGVMIRLARAADRPPVVAAGAITAAGLVATIGDLATARGAPVFWPFRWVAVEVMLVWLTLGWALAAAAASITRRPSPAVVRAAGAVADRADRRARGADRVARIARRAAGPGGIGAVAAVGSRHRGGGPAAAGRRGQHGGHALAGRPRPAGGARSGRHPVGRAQRSAGRRPRRALRPGGGGARGRDRRLRGDGQRRGAGPLGSTPAR